MSFERCLSALFMLLVVCSLVLFQAVNKPDQSVSVTVPKDVAEDIHSIARSLESISKRLTTTGPLLLKFDHAVSIIQDIDMLPVPVEKRRK